MEAEILQPTEHAPEETHAETTAHPAEEPGVLGSLGVNSTLFIAQLINFAIIVIVMWRFVYKPLLAMMDSREKEIRKGLTDATDAKKRLSEAEEEKNRLVREANAEAHALLEEARAKVEAVRAEKMAQTKTEIEKIALEAKERIRAEREASFSALRRDIADLVSQATKKVAAGMDEKAHRTEIDRAIADLDKANV
jgi:F-type H+-transporting ATPase subunit b